MDLTPDATDAYLNSFATDRHAAEIAARHSAAAKLQSAELQLNSQIMRDRLAGREVTTLEAVRLLILEARMEVTPCAR